MNAILMLAGRAFLNKTFFIWTVRFLAKQSDNLIDDNLVNLTEAAMDGDPLRMMEAGQRLIEEAAKEAKEHELI